MLLSAEVRWFWQGSMPPLSGWFAAWSPGPGGGTERPDKYLVDPSQTELGIKNRAAKPGLEIKSLVSVRRLLRLGPLTATAQIWTKVPTNSFDLAGLPCVTVNKRRWLRKYDTANSKAREIELGKDEKPISGEWPVNGCNVEFTEVWFEDSTKLWTSLGFEAFGPLERVEETLAAIVEHVGSRRFPDVGPGITMSYPEWLAEQALSTSRKS